MRCLDRWCELAVCNYFVKTRTKPVLAHIKYKSKRSTGVIRRSKHKKDRQLNLQYKAGFLEE